MTSNRLFFAAVTWLFSLGAAAMVVVSLHHHTSSRLWSGIAILLGALVSIAFCWLHARLGWFSSQSSSSPFEADDEEETSRDLLWVALFIIVANVASRLFLTREQINALTEGLGTGIAVILGYFAMRETLNR